MSTTSLLTLVAAGILLLVAPAAFADDNWAENYNKHMSRYYNHLREAEEEARDRDWDEYYKEIGKAERELAKARQYAQGGRYTETRRHDSVDRSRDRRFQDRNPGSTWRFRETPRWGHSRRGHHRWDYERRTRRHGSRCPHCRTRGSGIRFNFGDGFNLSIGGSSQRRIRH